MFGSKKQKKIKKAAGMSTKEKRAAAAKANVSLKNFKAGNTGKKYKKSGPAPAAKPPSSNKGGGNSSAKLAKERAAMSVKTRRAGRAESGMSMKEYKAGNKKPRPGNRNPSPGVTVNPHAAPGPKQQQSNMFTTAAGYEMEKGSYHSTVKQAHADYKKSNPNAGLSNLPGDYASFDDDGYLSYDSTIPQWQANNMLKEAGYKVGDMLWKPGALDNLKGRKLTGRIGSISSQGYYRPEYEYDASNSNHQGMSGNFGEVGLGADQAAYNKAGWEKSKGIVNGVRPEKTGAGSSGTNQYGDPEGTAYGVSDQGGQQSFDNYGSSQSDFEAPTQAASNFEMPNVQQSMGPQYQGWQEQMGNTSQSPYASRNKSSNMNFNFNPYKFQQGQ